MTTKEVKEQLQEDVLSILDGWGIEEAMDENDYEKMKNALCQSIIHNINKIEK